jgi:sulfide:quinone oxidoreductase
MSARRKHVVILGAGFGGLELATQLSERVPDLVRVTLIDQSESFMFGFAKLDVMFGERRLDEIRHYYRDLVKDGVEFRQETVVSIDPAARRVATTRSTYDADVLVVALGADLDPAATPGLVEGGNEFYSPEGAERLADILADFSAGVAVVGVLGSFFKCPPAPNEAALMLHDYLTGRGVREAVTIYLVSPLPSPIPISVATSDAIVEMLTDRGIHYWPRTQIVRVDPAGRTLHMADGRRLDFDLLLGIPVHRAPTVVVESGLTDDGWIAVDPATFATKFSDVYAVGDVTSAPVPRAGSIAEGEAMTLADVLVSRLTGTEPPPPYAGSAICYIESGIEGVARVDVNFLSGPAPTALFRAPSAELSLEKRRSADERVARWFGPTSRAGD